MLVLGIETSCDETSFALLQGEADKSKPFLEYLNSFKVRSSIVSSQIEKHIQYGGIIPEIGARLHAQQIHYLFGQLLNNYNLGNGENVSIGITADLNKLFDINNFLPILSDLDAIYVTTNPGLASALRVGLEFAKTIRHFVYQKLGKKLEIIEVNHLHGHIFSCFYQQNQETPPAQNPFPHLHLIVSGGNSQLLLLNSPNNIEIVGQTLDDAAGECLDKIGRMLGFPYPGGLNLAKVALTQAGNSMNFPVSMVKNTTLNYSFSGLKTSVRLFLESHAPVEFEFEKLLTISEIEQLKNIDSVELPAKLEFIKKVAISVQDVVVTQLTNKLSKAAKIYIPETIGVSGGVSANLLLREKISKITRTKVFIPPLYLTGDNAIMIALAGLANEYIFEIT
jgi:N6-L-threonylcarbamoyladenine synthase